MNLLVQLAADFFRAKGTNTEVFEKQKAELIRESEAYEKKLKQSRVRREKFASDLDAFWKKLDDKYAEESTQELLKNLEEKMRLATLLNPDEAAIRLISIEQEAFQDLEVIRKTLTVSRPMGVGLPKRLQEDWQTYQTEFKKLNDEQFEPCQREISHRIGDVAKQAKLYIDQRKRLEQQLDSLAKQRRNLLKESSDGAKKNATAAQKAVWDITDKAKRALDEVILNIQAEMNSTPIQDLSETEIENLRIKWESRLTQIENDHQRGVDAAKDMLSSLTDAIVESGGESAALAASALEKRVLDLEEQADQDFEMVQLGVAIAIINHEFLAAITEIRKGLRDLNAIAKQAPAIRNVYEQIHSNFEHLDGHLKLFTPLQRRINRKKLLIAGPELSEYIRGVFSARFLRHDIIMESTPSFNEFQIECFPSTIYPVVINLVDNAIFWLSSSQTDRRILLDATSNHIIIANNGPKIDLRDMERIFERGFSRKPGGRGLGLYISLKALAQERMRLEVVNPPEGYHAAFGIFKSDSSEGVNYDN
jgi:signal transduction histidine kinase